MSAETEDKSLTFISYEIKLYLIYYIINIIYLILYLKQENTYPIK